MSKTYGTTAKLVNQRIQEFLASQNLFVLGTLPGPRCHELKGSRKGELAVIISGNWRIIFEPNHDPLPLKTDGGLDWQKITSIKILEVIDYH
ncbi:MAG: killer suppression protein HigA [Brumimicrobium sp.]|nr:killer suppression protein HigA [Brumimicrobium sp.]